MATKHEHSSLSDFGISLSLSNLLFFRQWYGLAVFLPPQAQGVGFSQIYPQSYWAQILTVLITCVVFFSILRIVKKNPFLSTPLQLTFFSLLVLPLNFVRFLFADYRLSYEYLRNTFGPFALVMVACVFAFLIGWVVLRHPQTVLKICRGLLLIFLPFTFLTFSRAAIHAVPSNPAAVHKAPNPQPAPRRLLWLIFDALDERLVFRERPRDIKLPNLDRFRAQSTHATQAYPPSGCTQVTLPAYFTGQIRHIDGGNLFDWAKDPTIFSAAKKLGYRTALFGWYYPYCNLLGASLDSCYHTAGPNVNVRPYSNQISEGVFNAFYNFFAQEIHFKNEWFLQYLGVQNYHHIREQGIRAALDPTMGLVVIHWPIPHPPWIFDRRTMDFTLTNLSDDGYLDNLVLADNALGELRQQLESKNLWDETTIIVTSDHWSHESYAYDKKVDRRVPWMLKAKNQKTNESIHEPISTMISHHLTSAFLKGEGDGIAKFGSWILEKRGTVSSPIRCEDDVDPPESIQSPM